MPHDKYDRELKVGDRIIVEYVIKDIHLTEEYCNVGLETVEPMFPTNGKTFLTLNSKQVVLKPTQNIK